MRGTDRQYDLVVRGATGVDPSEGPTGEDIENGHFGVEAVIGADLDPGYGATARMLGEAGLCLVRGETDSPLDGGVLTPASGVGEPLAEGLRAAGFTAIVGDATASG